MLAVGRRDEINEHSAITIIVHDKNRNAGAIPLRENNWLFVGHDSDEYSSMLAKELPISDKNGVPLGIIKSVEYVKGQNIAMVRLIVRGTCLFAGQASDIDKVKGHGWTVRVIDSKYALQKPEIHRELGGGPLTDEQRMKHSSVRLEPGIEEKYLQLVSINSAPLNAV